MNRRLLAAAALLAALPALQGCITAAAVGAGTMALMVEDRRTTGVYVEDESIEEVEKGVFIPFIHRPLSRYVNAMVAAGLVIRRMVEPTPPPGFLARAQEYADAATIPRPLFLAAEKQPG